MPENLTDNKAKDSGAKECGGEHKDAASALGSQVHEEWGKKCAADKAAPAAAAKSDAAKPDAAKPEAAKPEAAKSEAAKPEAAKSEVAGPEADKSSPAAKSESAKATDAAKSESDSFWSWIDVPNIFDSLSSSSSDRSEQSRAGGDKPVPSTPYDASSKTPETGFWGSIKGAGHYLSGLVEKGWDYLDTNLTGLYSSVSSDANNKGVKIEAKQGADGKSTYFESRSDNDVRTLSAGEQRFRDSRGGTIVRNAATGEITSQSADGDEVYTRKADGTELLKTKDLEYVKDKEGKFHVRDKDGIEREISDQGAVTKLNNGFRIAQRITTIDGTSARPEEGQLETMKDGQRYMDHRGNIVVARDNGVREITTNDGRHLRIDTRNHTFAVEENGEWKTMSREEFRAMRHCHIGKGHDGHESYQIDSVKVDRDGKVDTDDKVTLGKTTPDGKMTAEVPSGGDKPAVVTNNPDHTSTVDVGGHVTKVNPDEPNHLVQEFKSNPDGTLGPLEFDYNSQNHTFWTPFAEFGPDGTHLGWTDFDIDSSGSIYSSSTGTLLYDSHESSYESSSEMSQSACQNASAAVAAVSGKIGSQAISSGDVAALSACLGDLDNALAAAAASGNFIAACQISMAKADLEGAISQASEQVALANIMRSNNMTDSQIVAAAGNVGSQGAFGAAISEEMAVMGPNAVSYEARMAYMNKYGADAMDQDQRSRLSA